MDWELIQFCLLKAAIHEMPKYLHRLSNQLNPLFGYFSMIEKYRENPEKFKDCFDKAKVSLAEGQELLRVIQLEAQNFSEAQD
jgi:hypothetical protein